MVTLKHSLLSLLFAGCIQISPAHSVDLLNIEPYHFEDLMGEVSLVWMELSSKEQEELSFYKKIFLKNNCVDTNLDSQAQPKLPKILHFIWLGPQPFPEESKRNLVSWQTLHPTWKMKFWTDHPERGTPISGMELCSIANVPFSKLGHLIPQATNYGEKSDLIRYEILFQQGGVYVDHDVFAIMSFDKLNHQYDFYAYLETPSDFKYIESKVRLNNGLIGVQPGHPILEAVMNHVSERWHIFEDLYPNSDNDSQIARTMGRTFYPFTQGVYEKIDQSNRRDMVFPASFGCPIFGFSNHSVIEQLEKRSLIYAKHLHTSLWCRTPKHKLNKTTRNLILILSTAMVSFFISFMFFYKNKQTNSKKKT